jgi:hypothetical protein
VGYKRGDFSSPIGMDAVTTAHGVTPPLPPAEIGHEYDHCYDNYVNQGFFLDRGKPPSGHADIGGHGGFLKPA